MKCRKGDLAIVVGGTLGNNAGKMVQCLELLPAGTEKVNKYWGPLWRTDRPLIFENIIGERIEKYLAPDTVLMPIRPDGESDELEERQPVSAGASRDE